jgi:hypothetical protein
MINIQHFWNQNKILNNKQSTQSINNGLYNKNVLKNDKSQTLTIDHLGDSGRLSLK